MSHVTMGCNNPKVLETSNFLTRKMLLAGLELFHIYNIILFCFCKAFVDFISVSGCNSQ